MYTHFIFTQIFCLQSHCFQREDDESLETDPLTLIVWNSTHLGPNSSEEQMKVLSSCTQLDANIHFSLQQKAALSFSLSLSLSLSLFRIHNKLLIMNDCVIAA
jgi:hypothetical protein